MPPGLIWGKTAVFFMLDDITLLAQLADSALHAGFQALARAQGENGEPGARQERDAAAVFARAAMQALMQRLQQEAPPVLLMMGQASPRRFGRGAPVMRIIATPVEGVADFSRGMPFSAFSALCLAAAPPSGPLDVATVRAALVHPLDGGSTLYALQQRQPWVEHQGQHHLMRTSNARALSQASLSVALNGHAPGKALADVLGRAKAVHATGSCCTALLAVARGQLDAHIDIRAVLTAEHWLAGAAFVHAAGGHVALLDDTLEQAGAPLNLHQRRGIVAAASRELLEEILSALRRAWL